MTSTYDPYFNPRDIPPDVPVGADARLEAYQLALEEATTALAKARDAELDAEEARDAKLREAQFSPACPPVGVFEGKRTTVAYQKAWIQDYAKDAEHDFRLARATRQAAQAHLRKVEKQGGFQQSITASVREQFRGTNGRQW